MSTKKISFVIIVIGLFFLLFLPASSLAERAQTHAHTIKLKLDPSGHSISAIDAVCCYSSERSLVKLFVSRRVKVSSVESAGRELRYEIVQKGEDAASGPLELLVYLDGSPEGPVPVTVVYTATFPDAEDARSMLVRGVSFSAEGVIDKEGAFLSSSSLWHPQDPERLASYDVTVDTPVGFEVVMEGVLAERSVVAERLVTRWVATSPLRGVNVVVGPYVVTAASHWGVNIYTYFYENDKVLSDTYISKVKSYLDLYGPRFPPYPFKKFAVVESFLPTGFGMPSFTLLGSRVLRLPFIPDTSLGHELAHNWWGNSLYVDPRGGNWSEALTSYLSDHLYKEMASSGEAASYRGKLLRKYRSFAAESALALSAFGFEHTTEGRSVGYDKGTMIFHMLRRHVGDVTFYASLSRLYREKAFGFASWDDIQSAFEWETGVSLDWFFSEWVHTSGAPMFVVSKPMVDERNGDFITSFVLRQLGKHYVFDLPVLLKTESGEVEGSFRIDDDERLVEFVSSERPVSVEVDPEHHVFRLLSEAEVPPLISSCLGGSSSTVVIPTRTGPRNKYRVLAESLVKDYSMFVADDRVEYDRVMKSGSVFILGGEGENALFERGAEQLPEGLSRGIDSFVVKGEGYPASDSFLVAAATDPDYPGKTLCIAAGGLKGEKLKTIARRLPHLTSKGYLLFTGDGALESGALGGERIFLHRFE